MVGADFAGKEIEIEGAGFFRRDVMVSVLDRRDAYTRDV
jgi:hypothetical protein